MITRTLEYPIADARLLVKGALELVDDIETYHDNGSGVITATTGFRFGLVASSYGESLTLSLRSVDDAITEVSVQGEKNVAVNIGANPEMYVLQFVQTLETLADYPLEDVIELLDQRTSAGTKEVASESDLADDTSVLAGIVLAVFLLGFLSIII